MPNTHSKLGAKDDSVQRRWLTQRYGRDGVRQVLSLAPATEIKPTARRLAALMFEIDQFNYAPRGSYPAG
jgi:hypothetical protein